jgi:general secretion pathway protein D
VGEQTIQLPEISITSVLTEVSVPDGGTILLGGIKTMSENRIEAGVPLLNKIPYVSRLFKNVGVGRSTTSLMMMVTPRIIIQEEEESLLGITDIQ